MRNNVAFIFTLIVFILWYLIDNLFPGYFIPIYLCFSLIIAFGSTYFSVPRFLRSATLFNPLFHRQVISTFLFYLILGVVLYVIF